MRKRCKKDLVWLVVLKDAEVMKFMLTVCRTSWDLIYVSTAVYVHCRKHWATSNYSQSAGSDFVNLHQEQTPMSDL